MRRTNPKFYDEKKDLIQCQLCGKWLSHLVSHISRIHKISCEEYKNKFLLFNGDLICNRIREKMSNSKKQPEISKKNLERFLKNIKPKKGKIPNKTKKDRYKKIFPLDLGRHLAHTSEALDKLSISLKNAHKTGKMNKAYESKKNGKYCICKNCGKKYYVSACREHTTKFCSLKCNVNSKYTKNKLKKFWVSQKGDEERKIRSKKMKKQWIEGKIKAGWKWKK